MKRSNRLYWGVGITMFAALLLFATGAIMLMLSEPPQEVLDEREVLELMAHHKNEVRQWMHWIEIRDSVFTDTCDIYEWWKHEKLDFRPPCTNLEIKQ